MIAGGFKVGRKRYVPTSRPDVFHRTTIPGVRARVIGRTWGIEGGGDPNIHVRELQSNATAVVTKQLGSILFGAPPEIVKRFLPDFFAGRGSLPTVLVLAKDTIKDGRLQNEPEFPLYGSFFLAKKQLRIVGTPEQIAGVKIILQETLLGPANLAETDPELARETTHFKSKDAQGRPLLNLEDYAEFFPLATNETAEIEGVKIVNLGEGAYRVIEEGATLANVDTARFTPPAEQPDNLKKEPLDPPRFGITFVGTSSGFDPARRTTSMILWAKRTGIFIDPLADPDIELNKFGVESKDLPYIFLTHCHADHDAGVLKRVLNGRRVKLITSRVIYESFLKKAKATAGIDVNHLIDFIEANPGDALEINGIRLEISQAFHAIPTIRFVAYYSEEGPDGALVKKSLAYSADTFFNQDELRSLQTQGIFSEARLAELLDFVLKCKADLLIHEAGMPPIHTPDAVLNALPSDIKAKTVLVHTGKVGAETTLPIAQAGATIELVPSADAELKALEAIASNPIFGALPVRSAVSAARASRVISFKQGETIVQEGDRGDEFYIVVSGKVNVRAGGKVLARLGKGDYFGEAALLQDKPRNATIEARSDGKVLVVKRAEFQKMLAAIPELEQTLIRVLEIRPVLAQITLLQGLPPDQLAALSARFHPKVYAGQKGHKLIEQGQQGKAIYVVKKGRVKVTVTKPDGRKHLVATLGPGAILGEISLLKRIPCTATVEIATNEAEVLVLPREEFERLSREIPSLTFHLSQLAEERLARG